MLVVDQAEELFALCEDPAERASFLTRLLDHAERAPVAMGLRADRTGELAAFPDAARRVAGEARERPHGEPVDGAVLRDERDRPPISERGVAADRREAVDAVRACFGHGARESSRTLSPEDHRRNLGGSSSARQGPAGECYERPGQAGEQERQDDPAPESEDEQRGARQHAELPRLRERARERNR